jgi:hypothetical protein
LTTEKKLEVQTTGYFQRKKAKVLAEGNSLRSGGRKALCKGKWVKP